jgi:hypothetical protein
MEPMTTDTTGQAEAAIDKLLKALGYRDRQNGCTCNEGSHHPDRRLH